MFITMKKNAFTYACAVVTLVIAMLLGAIFGVNNYAEKVAENAASQPIEADDKAVVKH